MASTMLDNVEYLTSDLHSLNIKQERDAHRCDRVKVLRYTNSLRAFQTLISGLTWSFTLTKLH